MCSADQARAESGGMPDGGGRAAATGGGREVRIVYQGLGGGRDGGTRCNSSCGWIHSAGGAAG